MYPETGMLFCILKYDTEESRKQSFVERHERYAIPRQAFVEPMGWVLGNAGEDVAQPGLSVHVVHLGRDDDTEHGGGALSAAIGTGEQPLLPTQGDRRAGARDRSRPRRRAGRRLTLSAAPGSRSSQHRIDPSPRERSFRVLRRRIHMSD